MTIRVIDVALIGSEWQGILSRLEVEIPGIMLVVYVATYEIVVLKYLLEIQTLVREVAGNHVLAVHILH
jgi:hypothetical protein